MKIYSGNYVFRTIGVGIAFVLVLSVNGEAGIVSTSGAIQLITPPNDVRVDQLESNVTLFVFSESSNVVLPVDIKAEITEPGFYNRAANLNHGMIPMGTIVNSYLVHGDNVDGTLFAPHLVGSLVFDEPVLGILIGNVFTVIPNPSLDDSDAILGTPTTIYGSGERGRGLFFPEDSVTLSADRLTVEVDFRTAFYYDQIRIVTVPEPSSIVMLVLSSGLVFLFRKVDVNRIRLVLASLT